MRPLLCLALLVLVGCAKKSANYQSANAEAGYYEDYGGGGGGYELDGVSISDDVRMKESAPSRSGGKGSSAPMAPPPPPPPPPGQPSPRPAPAPAPAPSPAPAPEPAAEQAPARMVHYDGYAQIRATKPADLIASVEAMATELGGRVDNLYGMAITIRVPVERFDEAWERTLAMGDVLSRSVRADDITDQFLAVDLRVRTLRTTRDRLVELLAKATEEEEKLALLAQITRVTEELDSFESQLRVLGDLAAMSQITVEAVPRERFAGNRGPEYDGFAWISQISPFRHAVFEDDKRIALVEPSGLVSLARKGPFVAESADGTVLWTFRIPNDPVGSGSFWVDAIEDRLGEQFTGFDKRAIGAWSCVDLDEAGADAPYRWQICVQPDGKHLNVAQTFYPSIEQVDRYGTRIEAALKGAGGDA